MNPQREFAGQVEVTVNPFGKIHFILAILIIRNDMSDPEKYEIGEITNRYQYGSFLFSM